MTTTDKLISRANRAQGSLRKVLFELQEAADLGAVSPSDADLALHTIFGLLKVTAHDQHRLNLDRIFRDRARPHPTRATGGGENPVSSPTIDLSFEKAS